ncbi:MFS family permease [Streptomyces sp. SAI-149]|nr:MFS family permease [Streptomyces sp. SAI-119]MDH6495141.1 MFS family permease [Streptomyces sp. SAI-149]
MSRNARIAATVGIFLCMAFSMGGIFAGSFSVFLKPVSESLGWATAGFTLIFTFSQIVMAVMSPVAGRIIDRIGVKTPLCVGVVFFALGLFGLSTMESTGAVYWLSAAAIGISGALAGPVVAMRVVASWYSTSRALFLGMVIAAAPQLAQSIVAQISRLLIADYGWRTAYEVFALAALVCGGSAAFFLVRTKPVDAAEVALVEVEKAANAAEPGVPAKQAFRSRIFWTIAGADALATGALVGAQTVLVNWMTGRGTSEGAATTLASILALSVVVGVLLSGYVADRAQSPRTATAFYLLPVLGLTLLLVSGTTFVLQLLGVILVGIGMATVAMLLPYLITRYFGLRTSAEIYGVSAGLNIVAAGLGSVLIGIGFDATGSYTLPISIALGATVIALLMMTTLKPYTYGVSTPEVPAVSDPPATTSNPAVY